MMVPTVLSSSSLFFVFQPDLNLRCSQRAHDRLARAEQRPIQAKVGRGRQDLSTRPEQGQAIPAGFW
jgi:hypothetical protein